MRNKERLGFKSILDEIAQADSAPEGRTDRAHAVLAGGQQRCGGHDKLHRGGDLEG